MAFSVYDLAIIRERRIVLLYALSNGINFA